MAGNGWLTQPALAQPMMRRGPRLALAAWALLAVVLLHTVALTSLARLASAQTSRLKGMDAPLYTRLLAPAMPPLQEKPAAALMAPAQPAIVSIAKQAARAASAAKPTPVRVEQARAALPELTPPTPTPEPESAPLAVAQAPSPPISLAQEASADTASSPAGSATIATSATSTTADGWPADTRLSYRVSGHFRGPLYGKAAVLWQRQAGDYQAQVDIDISLVPRQLLTSQGQITEAGLMPRVYEEVRFNKRRAARIGDTDIQFEGGRTARRPEGVQDTASQFVELTRRFATGRETLAVGRSISVWLARPGGVDRWTYDIAAVERLATPLLGEVEAFHLVPRPLGNPRGNITVEMWFAPSLQYLPVRIRVSMGEEAQVDLLVETIEQR